MSSENLICFGISGFENEQFVFECYYYYCSIFKLKIYIFSITFSFLEIWINFFNLNPTCKKAKREKNKEKDQFLGPEKRWGITTCLDF
jgi:hypothetical protein